MSEAELNELILISAGQIDSSFEYWLTISFGVLIATHVTPEINPVTPQIFDLWSLFGRLRFCDLTYARRYDADFSVR